jgi:TM2 domain-containing membrane protein YozV
MSSGAGSAGNVIAGLASFFIPGLGQLVQGRLIAAVLHFGLAVVLWFFLLGWIMNIWSALSAATYRGSD